MGYIVRDEETGRRNNGVCRAGGVDVGRFGLDASAVA